MTETQPSSFLRKFSKHWFWLLLLIAALGGGYYGYTQFYASSPAESAAADELQTALVQRGDLTIYASGSGTLVAAAEASFGFETSGQAQTILVSVGEQVEAGQVLAELDNSSQQLAYNQAKRELAELTSPYAIATAEQAVAVALGEVEDAHDHLSFVISPTVLRWEETIKQLETDLATAQTSGDDDTAAALETELAAAKESLAQGLRYYQTTYLPEYFTSEDEDGEEYVAAPSAVTIAEAHADYDLALATLDEAQNYLAALKGEQIPEDATGESLQTLEDARLNLASAEDELNNTQLIAPLSGTVMSLDFTVGDTVSANSEIVTIADLNQKNIEIYLDETDWDKVAVGYPAEVTFDALPDQVFNGTVIQVDPGLYTSNNSSVVHGIVALDTSDTNLNLPVGNSAAVDVIAASAKDALLVPIEALHQAGDQYAVFVLENGSPRLHVVEVGIQDILYAEILSGLNVGDTVTTGIVETQ